MSSVGLPGNPYGPPLSHFRKKKIRKVKGHLAEQPKENEQGWKYRDHIVEVGEKNQENFDKAVMSLSGGALGISMAFIRDIVGTTPATQPSLLYIAWICWVLSITFILWSFYTSSKVHRDAVLKFDMGERNFSKLAGPLDKLTTALNLISGLLFVAGVVFMAIFVSVNLGG